MAERPIALEGNNPLLIGAVAVLGAAAVLLWIGPGLSSIERARAALQLKQERFLGWDAEREAAERVTPEQQARWAKDFDRVLKLGETAPDDASLMARVARRLAAPSVRGLELARNGGAGEAGDTEDVLTVRRPFGETTLVFRRVPLRVRFDASYADAKAVLEKLAPERSGGIDLERVEIKRHFPDVRVELELAVWTREEVAS